MRIIRFIHKWTGLIIGLFFVLSCLSGFIIVLGKIIDSYAPIFKCAKQLHTNLFCGEIGENIIGWSTLFALIEIITGYILWGKRTIAMARSHKKMCRNPWVGVKRNLSFSFPTRLTGWHNAGGFWSGLPLLIMILTSLTWCFGWYSEIVYFLFEAKDSSSWDNNLFHTLHSLHVGSWGDLFSRLLWFVAVGIGASLPITGTMLFIQRLSGKRKSGKSKLKT